MITNEDFLFKTYGTIIRHQSATSSGRWADPIRLTVMGRRSKGSNWKCLAWATGRRTPALKARSRAWPGVRGGGGGHLESRAMNPSHCSGSVSEEKISSRRWNELTPFLCLRVLRENVMIDKVFRAELIIRARRNAGK